MPRKAPHVTRGTTSAELNGKTYDATYEVSGRPPMITVRHLGRSKTTQVGGSTADSIAHMLLLELIEGD
jgi:cysteine synthase